MGLLSYPSRKLLMVLPPVIISSYFMVPDTDSFIDAFTNRHEAYYGIKEVTGH